MSSSGASISDYTTTKRPHSKEYATSHVETYQPDEDSFIAERYTRYPNRWSRIRYVPLCWKPTYSLIHTIHSEYIREPAAEFFGVMVLIIFGTGVDCQVVLSGNSAVASSPKGVSFNIHLKL